MKGEKINPTIIEKWMIFLPTERTSSKIYTAKAWKSFMFFLGVEVCSIKMSEDFD